MRRVREFLKRETETEGPAPEKEEKARKFLKHFRRETEGTEPEKEEKARIFLRIFGRATETEGPAPEKEEKARKFLKHFRRATETKEIVPEKERIKIRDYLAKVVNLNDTAIGESVAIEDTRIIIKNSDSFMSIPLDAIIENNENIVVKDFNREESIQLGKEWFDRKDTMKFDEKGMLIREV